MQIDDRDDRAKLQFRGHATPLQNIILQPENSRNCAARKRQLEQGERCENEILTGTCKEITFAGTIEAHDAIVHGTEWSAHSLLSV